MKILLICNAGMSTSLLVKKMYDYTKENNIDAEIWAASDANSKTELKKADIIMLGPQVRSLESKIKELVDNKKPVVIIDTKIYGMMDGESTFKLAEESILKFDNI